VALFTPFTAQAIRDVRDWFTANHYKINQTQLIRAVKKWMEMTMTNYHGTIDLAFSKLKCTVVKQGDEYVRMVNTKDALRIFSSLQLFASPTEGGGMGNGAWAAGNTPHDCAGAVFFPTKQWLCERVRLSDATLR
jgi:hypothetical protein